jgi:hypothetical protein
MLYDLIPVEDERIAHAVIGAAIEVHRPLRAGIFGEDLRESARSRIGSPGDGCSVAEADPGFVQGYSSPRTSNRISWCVNG